ncbi:MAG: dGTP triphosphohydrolase [Mariniblastus sp.]
MLDWQTLMSDFRCPYDGKAPKASIQEPFRTAFQADYDRIIYSKPFRRLARKTQVHPLAPNDHIHNRLTHSLEVASVGRSFASMLWKYLKQSGQTPRQATADDFRQVMQAACLAHDIGNPPFGHAGEFAIRTWVKDDPESIFGDGEFELSDGIKKDWEIFEGNAQGFRLALLPDNPRAGYMRLTYATLGAMIKYPWCSTDPRASKKQKYNVFSTERAFFEQAFSQMGLCVDNKFVRHPLSFLSEAADDICYRIADLEDAVKMGILDAKRVRNIFATVCGEVDSTKPIGQLRAGAINCFINGCWSVFENNYQEIMNGKRDADLATDLEPSQKDSLAEIKHCYEEIFAHPFKVSTEFGAYRCLGKVASVLCDSARKLCRHQSFDQLDFPVKRCFDLAFGREYAIENEKRPYQWWMHQTLDCVVGMTDNYAKQFAKDLEGF